MLQLHPTSFSLGKYEEPVDKSLRSLATEETIHRIWTHDYSVWKSDPTEISDRLDWLHTPSMMLRHLPRFAELVDEVRSAGFTELMLLGMGGSSLAPAVLSEVFGNVAGFPRLKVLDNTDPDDVTAAGTGLDVSRTLFMVSSKSGGTLETLSLMKYFYGRALETVGNKGAASQFLVITDPGSNLAAIAESNLFRAEILNDPNIGGRYSVISYDGLVPAALMGIDVERLAGQAVTMATACEPSLEPQKNPGAYLGTVLGELERQGRNKVTIFLSRRIAGLGRWIEQIIAESTGKDGKGIVPVVGEPLGPVEAYGDDRLFVVIQLDSDEDAVDERAISSLESRGHPVIRVRLQDVYEIGQQFFLWEMATAVAGSIMGINPFDQPNVEANKKVSLRMIADYRVRETIPRLNPSLQLENVTVYGDARGESPASVLMNFLDGASPGAYIAIQAYIHQTERTDVSLRQLRAGLMRRFRLATTVGYGPRFLHSTGQLHKGDSGRGLFVQITSDKESDPRVPDELGSSVSSLSFAVLEEAEALGDRQALLDSGRRVIRFHVKGDVPRALDELAMPTA